MTKQKETVAVVAGIIITIAFFLYHRTMSDKIDHYKSLYNKADFEIEYLLDKTPADNQQMLNRLLKEANEEYKQGAYEHSLGEDR